MGKPGDIEEARQMLTKLSGHTHSVITGVAIVSRNVFFDFFEESLVEFGPLDSYQTELIEKYIHSNSPMTRPEDMEFKEAELYWLKKSKATTLT